MAVGNIDGVVSGSISTIHTVSGTVDIPKGTVPEYDGDYSVDPSADAPVVLETEGKKLTDNIVVNQVQETISATDDGYGNITLTGNITVIDDGNGNITL